MDSIVLESERVLGVGAAEARMVVVRALRDQQFTMTSEQVSIVMDAALGESRQQALALRTIFAQLGVGKLGDVASREVSALDQLAAARAARRAPRPPAPAHPNGATGA